jgi:hypothetical protein
MTEFNNSFILVSTCHEPWFAALTAFCLHGIRLNMRHFRSQFCPIPQLDVIHYYYHYCRRVCSPVRGRWAQFFSYTSTHCELCLLGGVLVDGVRAEPNNEAQMERAYPSCRLVSLRFRGIFYVPRNRQKHIHL